jgi:hypothetical protein
MMLLPAVLATALAASATHEPAHLSVCPPSLAAGLPASAPPPQHATLHAAQAEARRLLAAGHSADIVVELCAGAHPLQASHQGWAVSVISPARPLTIHSPLGSYRSYREKRENPQ